MRWTQGVVGALVVLNAGWMAFDGGRALIVGEYVTPRSGRYAGKLGPWSKVAEAAGIEPRSTLMKSIFLVYGLAYLIVLVGFVLNASWAWWAMLVMTIGGLWYLPFGTLINIVVMIMLFLPASRLPS